MSAEPGAGGPAPVAAIGQFAQGASRVAEPVFRSVRGEDDVARSQRDRLFGGRDQPIGPLQDDMEAGARVLDLGCGIGQPISAY